MTSKSKIVSIPLLGPDKFTIVQCANADEVRVGDIWMYYYSSDVIRECWEVKAIVDGRNDGHRSTQKAWVCRYGNSQDRLWGAYNSIYIRADWWSEVVWKLVRMLEYDPAQQGDTDDDI